jgi:DNA-binding response OmpR family regulator
MTTRILIADADAMLTEVYGDHVTRCGFVVRTAVTGLSCVARLREFCPDLLVLATSLLWGGCEGVLAMMDSQGDLRPEVVIVLAGTRERKTLRRLASYDVDGYLWKPLSPASLVRHLETMLMERAEQQAIALDR